MADNVQNRSQFIKIGVFDQAVRVSVGYSNSPDKFFVEVYRSGDAVMMETYTSFMPLLISKKHCTV